MKNFIFNPFYWQEKVKELVEQIISAYNSHKADEVEKALKNFQKETKPLKDEAFWNTEIVNEIKGMNSLRLRYKKPEEKKYLEFILDVHYYAGQLDFRLRETQEWYKDAIKASLQNNIDRLIELEAELHKHNIDNDLISWKSIDDVLTKVADTIGGGIRARIIEGISECKDIGKLQEVYVLMHEAIKQPIFGIFHTLKEEENEELMFFMDFFRKSPFD